MVDKEMLGVRVSEETIEKLDTLGDLLSGSRSSALRFVVENNVEAEIESLRELRGDNE